MKKHEAERLIEVIRELSEDGSTASKPGGRVNSGSEHGSQARTEAHPPAPRPINGTPPDMEAVYQFIKTRFLEDARIDPILLQLLTSRPEIIVEVEPRVVTLDGSTPRGRMARLIASGWFAEARAAGTVRKEMARTGNDPGGGGSLHDNLKALVTDGFLVRDGDGYTAAPGVKVSEKRLEA